ncbi:glycosyltransferase family 2 protein [Bacteroides intestinalis]|uniref:glycosyltransferase family 2 protein n=1 Tax=Bacteroides intestinalis TaxID=329854 RepID=UPI0022E8A232|nr:glycosyltransferase family 2 protein [Bacteroides intestinalis]
MMNNDILLSICVPTYNGARRIQHCIDRLLDSRKERNDVEIIISNNGSTDGTDLILEKYKNCKRLKINSNKSNLGFIGNIAVIIDQLSNGKYTWIIGDDDLVDIDAIDIICSTILYTNTDYISVKHRLLNLEQAMYFKYLKKKDMDYYQGNYFSVLDINASAGNILGTFMSSQVFKTEVVRKFDKTLLGINDWTSFVTTFPNSYMMTMCFCNSDKCISINTPLITALLHSKSWDDKLFIVATKILPEYYAYCLRLGASKNDLYNNNYLIAKGAFCYYLKELKIRNIKKINFNEFVRYVHTVIKYHVVKYVNKKSSSV